MKPILAPIFLSVACSAKFIDRQTATTFIRHKRANSWREEWTRPSDYYRECTREDCDFQEYGEIFENFGLKKGSADLKNYYFARYNDCKTTFDEYVNNPNAQVNEDQSAEKNLATRTVQRSVKILKNPLNFYNIFDRTDFINKVETHITNNKAKAQLLGFNDLIDQASSHIKSRSKIDIMQNLYDSTNFVATAKMIHLLNCAPTPNDVSVFQKFLGEYKPRIAENDELQNLCSCQNGQAVETLECSEHVKNHWRAFTNNDLYNIDFQLCKK